MLVTGSGQTPEVIDTEPGGTAGLPGGAAEQALLMIRPHGAERAWRLSRPYMLPG